MLCFTPPPPQSVAFWAFFRTLYILFCFTKVFSVKDQKVLGGNEGDEMRWKSRYRLARHGNSLTIKNAASFRLLASENDPLHDTAGNQDTEVMFSFILLPNLHQK